MQVADISADPWPFKGYYMSRRKCMSTNHNGLNWKKNPLPAYKHSLFCSKGTACPVPGCKEMKSCSTHTQNCSNEKCPAPPCIARRQLASQSQCFTYLDDIFRCALLATDICPIVPKNDSSQPTSSAQEPSTSADAQLPGQESPVFRVPTSRPPRNPPRSK